MKQPPQRISINWKFSIIICFGALLLIILICAFNDIEYGNLSVQINYDKRYITKAEYERVKVKDVITIKNFIALEKAASNHSHGIHGDNQLESDKIGAFRALPDTRDDICSSRPYYIHKRHSKVSVIIAFHNEPRSTLMRTIMSLYRRSSAEYLHEIILIDDFSDDDTLLVTLQHLDVPPFAHSVFINSSTSTSWSTSSLSSSSSPQLSDSKLKSTSPFTTMEAERVGNKKVARAAVSSLIIKMQRNSRRLGLIESRNLGAQVATGHYLLFLDSHCEVNVGWLEPLLERATTVRDDDVRTTIAVSPILDGIDANTFRYQRTSQHLMGGFDWNLHFHWMRRQSNQHDSLNHQNSAKAEDSAKPFRSPVVAGGIFLISKHWFLKLNGFNTNLKIWGGESIEFSIKLWLCGGQIEFVPCSRIGHIFRKRHTFEFSNGDSAQVTYLRNSKYIAESWLDSYKYLFYASKPEASNIPVNVSQSELNAFKEQHRCYNFTWYLDNVFPQLRPPNDNYIAYGTLSAVGHCLHIKQSYSTDNSSLHSSSTVPSTAPPDNRRRRYPKLRQHRIELSMASCYHVDVTQWYLHRQNGHLTSGNGACLNVVRHSDSKASNAVSLSSSSSSLLPFTRTNRSNGVVLPLDIIKPSSYAVVLQYCRHNDNSQRWQRRGSRLIHEQTHFCLDNPLSDVIAVSHCRQTAPTQSFRFSVEVQQQSHEL